ncbi:hypothetical protein GCM10010495_05080 [Kitasatospora herbaricolor]|uniref:DUF2510 domain-containing protein n=1 Tax=Kitasatospora herbaricolor TaxID=68217 RepID=UPI0019A152D6|nr:DUF2510 domain-containing protein [Kitasatospora herbaricolor]MDQ0311978.1 hypothetical protein [Kitasatospora herbaricolor]GGU97601.1 hypothetical protein GCM10010495_05080 [Kitasatospora herbaricolor]
MSETIPAGWYPDPQDTTSDPRPQRWWDGKAWTAGTRPAPSDAPASEETATAAGAPAASDTTAGPDAPADAPAADPVGAPAAPAPGAEEETRVLEGEVLQNGAAVRYPELPPPIGAVPGGTAPGGRKKFRKPSRAVVVAASVAALLGLAVGSGVTFLAVDGHSETRASHRDGRNYLFNGENGPRGGAPGQNGRGGQGVPNLPGQNGQGVPNLPGQNGQNGQGGGGQGQNGGRGGGNGSVDGVAPGTVADLVNRITLPVPSGWDGGTLAAGYAALTVGSYTCAGTESDSCSLGGVVTSRIEGTDAQAAAKADIAKAAQESYGDSPSHEELKSEAVKVAGRDGYLVRWKVKAAKGNDGYVETVVFPTSDGKALTALHLGFDVDPKAPDLALMDTIVKGVAEYTGKALPGGAGDGTTT